MNAFTYQDIKQITGVPVVNQKPEGIFDIPVQFEATHESFDTSIPHIESWAAQLPMADAKKCARELIQRLDEINRIDISKRHRLKLSEILVDGVYKTTRTLKQHYISQGLPLSDKSSESVQLADKLNTLFAMTYKIYLEQSWDSGVTLFNRKTITLVLYRAMFFISESLLNAYESYRVPSPHLWRQLHQLFQYSREEKLQHTILKLDTEVEQRNSKSIISLYKKILLIGLISPYRLRQIITDKLYRILDSWNEYADIVPYKQHNNGANLAVIDLHSDTAPSFHRTKLQTHNPQTHYLMIDTSKLVNFLNDHLLQRSKTKHLSGETADIPYNALKMLLVTWDGKSKRAFSRANTQNQIAISLGLSATHDLIHKQEEDNSYVRSSICESARSAIWDIDIPQSEIEKHEDPVLELPANFVNHINFRIENNANVLSYWDPEFSAKSVNNSYNIEQYRQDQQEKLLYEETQQFQPLDYSNINESAGGFCLVGQIKPTDHTHKVKVGELISIFHKTELGDEIFNIGVIRRVQCSEDETRLGVEKLAPCAESIAACVFQQNRKVEQYTRSLVLPELKSIKQPVTLITNNFHSVNDRLVLNKRGYKTVVKLTRLLESTDVFSQFEFSISHVLGYEDNTHEELELEEPKQNSEWSLL